MSKMSQKKSTQQNFLEIAIPIILALIGTMSLVAGFHWVHWLAIPIFAVFWSIFFFIARHI